uniref:Uncharacterized protein n=1 Tax=Ditylum brightwellii TaxID=49249 RepID=A0A6U3SM11_9STRA|mmetsp:Transcript_33809/g.50463  ORF Transcript_33809/g.50463 Transcript_33809/m.50463 type:complete len:842 (+) Transcript_33809:3-2528(+)
MNIFASKRFISDILSQISAEGTARTTNNSIEFDRVLDRIGMFATEPPKKPNLEAPDIETFRKSLTSHMVEINKAVNKNMVVNARGMVAFTYNTLTISIEPTSAQKMLLSTTVADNPNPGSYKHAMQLNYLQQETRGGVIACGDNGELYFMYEDSINVNPSDFRNILENFIDTALDLNERLHRNSGPLHLTEEGLERDMKNKTKTIKDFRDGDKTLLQRIFAQSDSKVIQGNIDALTFTVVDANDMDVLRFLVSTTLELAKSTGDDKAIRETFFKRVCEKDMFDDDLLRQLVEGAEPNFELNNINSIFISSKLLGRKKIASTAQKLIDLHCSRCLGHIQDAPEYVIQDWNKIVLSLFSISKTSANVEETIAGLDWIISHTSPEKIGEGESMASALHYAASHGHVKLAEYILDRFPKLSLDEDTLLWACKLNHTGLVEFIINRSKDLPRNKALEAAGASGSVKILKALGVGRVYDEGDEKEQSDELIDKALADAAEAAISHGNWDALECIVSDRRLKAPLRGFLLKASSCSYPQKAIEIILKSRFAADQSYICRIPWQAQALVLDKQVTGLLHVMSTCGLPMEIGGMVWNFLKPICEDAPVISSSHNFLEKFRVQLERDLDISDIRRKDNDTFVLSGIGDLNFRDGFCCVKKRFDVDGVSIEPSGPLRMSFELGGCFLGTRKLHSGVWLQRVVSLDNSFKYTDLRLMLRSFAHVSRIVSNVLTNAKKFNVTVPASNISSIVRDARSFTQVRAENVVQRLGRHYTFSHFSQTKLVRVTTPCCNSGSMSEQTLLEDNMATPNETFFCTDKDGNVCAAAYLFPENVDDPRYFAVLSDKASVIKDPP